MDKEEAKMKGVNREECKRVEGMIGAVAEGLDQYGIQVSVYNSKPLNIY